MTDAPPFIIDEDAAIDSAFFGSHAGRTCYARGHRSGWVLVVRQVVAQRDPPVMLRVWSRVDRVPDDDAPGAVGAVCLSALTVALQSTTLGATQHRSGRPGPAIARSRSSTRDGAPFYI